MTMHKYEIGSDDVPRFTANMVAKLPKVKSIPPTASEIRISPNLDADEVAQIEAIYGRILKWCNVYIDENEIVYFEFKE